MSETRHFVAKSVVRAWSIIKREVNVIALYPLLLWCFVPTPHLKWWVSAHYVPSRLKCLEFPSTPYWNPLHWAMGCHVALLSQAVLLQVRASGAVTISLPLSIARCKYRFCVLAATMQRFAMVEGKLQPPTPCQTPEESSSYVVCRYAPPCKRR